MAAAAVRTRVTSKPSRRSPATKRLADGIVVLDHENSHVFHSFPRPISIGYSSRERSSHEEPQV